MAACLTSLVPGIELAHCLPYGEATKLRCFVPKGNEEVPLNRHDQRPHFLALRRGLHPADELHYSIMITPGNPGQARLGRSGPVGVGWSGGPDKLWGNKNTAHDLNIC